MEELPRVLTKTQQKNEHTKWLVLMTQSSMGQVELVLENEVDVEAETAGECAGYGAVPTVFVLHRDGLLCCNFLENADSLPDDADELCEAPERPWCICRKHDLCWSLVIGQWPSPTQAF